MSQVLAKRALVADVDNCCPAKNKYAKKQEQNSSHYFPFVQHIPAARQGSSMIFLPQSDQEVQYDENKIQIDHHAQEREISVIEGFWPCIHAIGDLYEQ